MAISFDGQVVIVTGAGQGLGREYALELGRRGARIVVNDLSGLGSPEGSAAAAVVAEIRSAGGTAVASHDSVATPEGGKAIVDLALENFGTVDAVVHNAGVWRHELFEDMTADQLDPVLDVHLRGAFFVTQPAWPIMQKKGYGRIVLTSSSSGAFGRIRGTNYAAAKAAMLGLGRALSLEGEQYGIKTNCILPIAPFRTRGDVPAALTDQLHSAGLSPDDAGPELVAPMVVYLASAACTVSGEAFSAGGRRFGRVFIGVADGWLAPADGCPTAEDIEAHLDDIEDLSRYATPASSFEELRGIGELLRVRKEGLE
jgi:NAD(P)-dependent dehydrogenase (short-subunit alcohol dehydrogenase family)